MFNKKYTLYIVAVLTAIFLSACGGGGGDDGSTSNEKNNEVSSSTDITIQPQNTPSNISKGIVELGLTKGASVSIHALDGYTLITLNRTDENGEFNININELKQEVQSYNPDMKLVKIISTGGIDTDPDDDGIKKQYDEKSINGEVKSIVPLNTLYSSNGYRVNFITSMVADILEDAENIDEEYINQVIKKLDVDDIDKDGKLTIKDIIFYDMVKNDSVLEANLRTQYLDTFHSGDVAKKEEVVKGYKQSIGTTKEIIKYNNKYSEFIISLEPSKPDNYILFGITNNIQEPELKKYTSPLLTNNCLFVYQECDSENNCNNLTKIFFEGDEYYYNEFHETMPDVDIESIVNKIDELENKIAKMKVEIEILNSSMDKSITP